MSHIINIEDLSVGTIVYVAHPEWGIIRHKIMSAPFTNYLDIKNKFFIQTKTYIPDYVDGGDRYVEIDDVVCLNSIGLIGDNFYFKTFFDTASAEMYIAETRNDPTFKRLMSEYTQEICINTGEVFLISRENGE